MKPGIYKLDRHIENPQKIDKRRTDWYHRSDFKVGELFIISHRAIDFDAPPDKPITFIGMRGSTGFWNFQSVRRQEPLATLMLASSVMVDHTKDIKSLLMYFREVECKNASYESVVRSMLEKKFLSLDMVKGICEEMK